MVASIFSLFADDRPDLPRPAVLPDVLFADMHRDPLVSVPLLFELSFRSTAAPLFEGPIFAADAGPLSFFGPDSSHNLYSVALLIALRTAGLDHVVQLRDISILSQKQRF